MNLYLRLLRLILMLPFVRRAGVFEAAQLRFCCWPHDCDFNLHMNNGRYLTLMDLGRVHLLAQLGLLGHALRNRWSPVLSGAEMSWLRPLLPFRRFDLVTRLVSWDEKYFYIEQRFESEGRLCALATVQGLFLCRGERVPSRQALDLVGLRGSHPPVNAVLAAWRALREAKRQTPENPGSGR